MSTTRYFNGVAFDVVSPSQWCLRGLPVTVRMDRNRMWWVDMDYHGVVSSTPVASRDEACHKVSTGLLNYHGVGQ